MIKRLSVLLVFFCIIAPAVAQAQATDPGTAQSRPAPRLRSFMKDGPMSSPKEYADRIRACATNKIWNMSCEEILSSFNQKFRDVEGIGPMESIEELAKFFEDETVRVPCKPGKTRIAGVAAGGRVSYFDRWFAPDEYCFHHINTGTPVSSAWCGQWIDHVYAHFQASNAPPPGPSKPEAPVTGGPERELRRDSGNRFVRFLKEHKWPIIIGGSLVGGATAFLLTRSTSEAEASPSIGITIKIGG